MVGGKHRFQLAWTPPCLSTESKVQSHLELGVETLQQVVPKVINALRREEAVTKPTQLGENLTILDVSSMINSGSEDTVGKLIQLRPR